MPYSYHTTARQSRQMPYFCHENKPGQCAREGLASLRFLKRCVRIDWSSLAWRRRGVRFLAIRSGVKPSPIGYSRAHFLSVSSRRDTKRSSPEPAPCICLWRPAIKWTPIKFYFASALVTIVACMSSFGDGGAVNEAWVRCHYSDRQCYGWPVSPTAAQHDNSPLNIIWIYTSIKLI